MRKLFSACLRVAQPGTKEGWAQMSAAADTLAVIASSARFEPPVPPGAICPCILLPATIATVGRMRGLSGLPIIVLPKFHSSATALHGACPCRYYFALYYFATSLGGLVGRAPDEPCISGRLEACPTSQRGGISSGVFEREMRI